MKLKPFQAAEWHNMCADRVHAGVKMWVGKIPPMKWINRAAPVEASWKSDELRESAKRKKTTMKKLMTIAAAAALAATVEAGIAVHTTNCTTKVGVSKCPQVVFKVTGSGKALDPVTKDYATVSKLKVNGWLVLFPEEVAGGCCYPTYSLYVSAKIGKNKTDLVFAGAQAEGVDAWTVFGKNLEKAETSVVDPGKKSKKFKLESQLGVSADVVGDNADGTLLWADDISASDDDQPLVSFIATSFGKATWKTLITPGCTKCDKATLDGYEITPGNYSGWFAGFYYEEINEECLTCECTNLALFGGTWKAKYQTKIATWEAAISNLFGAATLKAMQEEGIE